MEEASFGIIPLHKKDNQWEVLLIQHVQGHWTFPKGHAEEGESALQTAERELLEETGLRVKTLLNNAPILETYHFSKQQQHIKKTVAYFIAEVEGTLSLQKEEVLNAKWVVLTEAPSHLTFVSAQALCKRVSNLVR